MPFTISPKYEESFTLSLISKGSDLGLANCPASLPTFTIGKDAPYVKTAAICKITRNESLKLSALNSAKDSAQSPPCNKNALPSDTSANLDFNVLASPAKTKGGSDLSFSSTSFNLFVSEYTG